MPPRRKPVPPVLADATMGADAVDGAAPPETVRLVVKAPARPDPSFFAYYGGRMLYPGAAFDFPTSEPVPSWAMPAPADVPAAPDAA